MAMNPNNGGIDHGVSHIGLVRDRVEHALENIGFYPIAKAFEDGIPVPKRKRQVPPETARPRDPQHSLDEQPGIASCSARVGRLTQAKGLHLLLLRVGQAEPVHGKLLSELEPRPTWSRKSPDSQQALERLKAWRRHWTRLKRRAGEEFGRKIVVIPKTVPKS